MARAARLALAVALLTIAIGVAAQGMGPGPGGGHRRGSGPPRGEKPTREEDEPPRVAPPPQSRARAIDLKVTERGFEPNRIEVAKGEQVRLVVLRTAEKSCATALVVDELVVFRELPIGRPIEISFTAGRTGDFPFTCPTGELKGILHVVDELTGPRPSTAPDGGTAPPAQPGSGP